MLDFLLRSKKKRDKQHIDAVKKETPETETIMAKLDEIENKTDLFAHGMNDRLVLIEGELDRWLPIITEYLKSISHDRIEKLRRPPAPPKPNKKAKHG